MPDQILLDIIDEHLPYEIDMFRLAYLELVAIGKPSQAETPQEKARRFALIKSLSVHARSLVEFFLSTSTNPNDVLATEFTSGFTSSLDPVNGPLKDIRTKLNKQIFHLTKDRTLVVASKFDAGTDGGFLVTALEAEIKNFSNCLLPDFRAFRTNTNPLVISAAGPLGATGQVTHTTSVIGGETGSIGPRSTPGATTTR